MAAKVRARESGDVSDGKVSMVEPGLVEARLEEVVERVVGERARRARARFP